MNKQIPKRVWILEDNFKGKRALYFLGKIEKITL